ncbi:MAG: lytic transglycosylase domain-containing protein [Bacteroidales bacterium]|nr:lytic transglycosylase domain-containing protein [Bacteroidales bacterium]
MVSFVPHATHRVFNETYVIKSPPFPDTVFFAGERVPVHFMDVRESLDREMLINIYWQSQTVLFIKRANKFFPEIEKILAEQGVPNDFKYLPLAESGLLNVVSPAGAEGYWQLLEGTAKDYGLMVNQEIDDRYNLGKATLAACSFLKESYQRYGSWTMAAASYNMGRRALDSQMERQHQNNYYDILFNEETSRYVYRLIAIKTILENPAKYGFLIENEEKYAPYQYRTVQVDTTIADLASFASLFGTNYKVLKLLNPWLRENYLPNPAQKVFDIRIPLEKGRIFTASGALDSAEDTEQTEKH